MSLHKLTCSVEQSRRLVELGIETKSFLFHNYSESGWFTDAPSDEGSINVTDVLPAWTKAELDAMIGPYFQKPDFWNDGRITKGTDPLTYPVFFLNVVNVFSVGAQASAHGLIILLEQEYILPGDANERYREIFLK